MSGHQGSAVALEDRGMAPDSLKWIAAGLSHGGTAGECRLQLEWAGQPLVQQFVSNSERWLQRHNCKWLLMREHNGKRKCSA